MAKIAWFTIYAYNLEDHYEVVILFKKLATKILKHITKIENRKPEKRTWIFNALASLIINERRSAACL